MAASIGDYALLSDCQSAALVSRDGSVDWWPGQRFDGPSVFSRLLDPDAGHFRVRPVGDSTTRRRYLDGTLVLETEHRTGSGTLRVTDCLALEGGARGHQIGMRSPHALVRVAEALEGEVEVDVELVPKLEYGLAVPRLIREDGIVQSLGGPERLFLTGAGDLELDGAKASGRIRVAPERPRGFVLHRVPGLNAQAPAPLDATAAQAATVGAWRSWSELHRGYDGPYRDQVHHAALVLQALTYQPSGAVVAAVTTSLPEVPGSDRNWDYRFAWLRDASLIARSLLRATCADEAQRYFEWMSRAAVSCRESEQVPIVFGPDGERELPERELEHLRGYADSRPVRVGNAAWRQKQLDVLGEVLNVALALRDGPGLELDSFTGGFLCQLVDRAAEQWRDPDAGLWEDRGGDRHHTFSKAMCWVALDRGVRLGDALGERAQPDRWARERDRVRGTVLAEAWSERRRAFAGRLGGDDLDAAVLLLPLVGFVDAADDRMRRTVAAITETLGDRGLLRRDEQRTREGAFLPASFWLAGCQAMAGEVDGARATFERAAGCANDVGLLAEMADPATGEPLGNVPQALAHVGLVTAAQCIGDAEQGRAGAAA